MKTLLRSKHIYDGVNKKPYKGFIIINNDRIEKVGFGWDYANYLSKDIKVEKYDDDFVMYGVHDNHTFFSGYLLLHAGVNLSKAISVKEAIDLIKQTLSPESNVPIYGYGWDRNILGDLPTEYLDQLRYSGPITAISSDRSYCWMNSIAIKKYGFTPWQESAEERVNLLKEMISDDGLVNKVFQQYQNLLLSKGVVSVKEIVFDDYEFIRKIKSRKILTNLYVQPVAHTINWDLLCKYQSEKYITSNIKFSGIKVMVDGVVADKTGDISGDYFGGSNLNSINYTRIKKLAKKASALGISCCLTAEGDRAIYKAARILEGSKEKGVINSISDLEMIGPDAAQQMNEKDIVAEIYPQILGLNKSYSDAYMDKVIENEDGRNFYNYKSLLDNDVKITCGTDLPLFITDIPESIINCCYRLFPDGSGPWFGNRGIGIDQLLKGWTIFGYNANYWDDYGTIESGKKASLAIFNNNLFNCSPHDLKNVKVVTTYVDGDVVFQS